MFRSLLLASAALCVSAHVRWVNPVPRNDNSGLKSYPCGNIAPSANKTALQPGEQLVKWEETINHVGAPFRFAISTIGDTNFDSLILLDHVPHNDAGGGTFTSPKPYELSLKIPNINCPACVLQIVNPMTDKESGPCDYPTAGKNTKCVSVYHSCADISITGTQDPAAFIASYVNPPTTPYLKESGTATQWVQQGNGAWLYFPSAPTAAPAPTAPASPSAAPASPSAAPAVPTGTPATPTPAPAPDISSSPEQKHVTLFFSASIGLAAAAIFSSLFPEAFDVLSSC